MALRCSPYYKYIGIDIPQEVTCDNIDKIKKAVEMYDKDKRLKRFVTHYRTYGKIKGNKKKVDR